MLHRTTWLGLLAIAAALSTSHAQAQSFGIGVARTAGSLDEATARGVVEAARGALAACATSPSETYEYALSLRANGTVREAAYDRRGAGDARGARCIRHALLELHFPAHAEASTFALTLGGPSSAPPPSAPPPSSTAAAPSPSPSPAPSSPSPSPSPSATPTPTPTSVPTLSTTPAPTAVPVELGDVRIGPLESTPERTADLLRSVVAAQLGSISACFATGRRTDPSLGGEAILHATITPDGHVSAVMFQAPEALASALAACVGTAARTWTFSAASAEERANIPLSFGPQRPQRR